MQRSSETVSQIAGALARAQAELENPEKVLTATIISPFPREETLSLCAGQCAAYWHRYQSGRGSHPSHALPIDLVVSQLLGWLVLPHFDQRLCGNTQPLV
jgi:hypothetical protein